MGRKTRRRGDEKLGSGYEWGDEDDLQHLTENSVFMQSLLVRRVGRRV